MPVLIEDKEPIRRITTKDLKAAVASRTRTNSVATAKPKVTTTPAVKLVSKPTPKPKRKRTKKKKRMPLLRAQSKENVSPTGSGSYVDPALRQIDEVVNKELEAARSNVVDMQAPIYFLVLDTNVLLGYLEVLEQFVRDCEKCGAPVQIIIPGVVVRELDGQKTSKSTELGWNARMASTWILNELKEKRIVKGQAYTETLQCSGTWKIRDADDVSNDDLIIDCCLYFRKIHPRTVVISADNNLCSEALAQDVNIINPRDSKRWSSRLLAFQAFKDRQDIEQIVLNFSGPSDTRRSKRQQEALEKELGEQPPPRYVEYEVDGMDIDDGYNADAEPSREHLLDDLHRQILSHFTALLSELARRAAPEVFSGKPVTSDDSMHSPVKTYSRMPAKQWKAGDYVKLLSSTGLIPTSATDGDKSTIRAGSTRLASFLTDAYEHSGRKGQEWSRADWYFCLEVLECLGRAWSDEPILLSLAMLLPQVDVDFCQPMRPT
ncbi:hypothetical protein SCHPADRAFT_900080 [Schizopora paradoxa]|uniref:PIN domain-containing protein n=1 Tax=Schizopora paradoxa TaxID=27342 RepID=A0A0H2S188_9AGAM|nr:hypothetical protein SCHPADRAFT_900080 [Schizopora paradoxa]